MVDSVSIGYGFPLVTDLQTTSMFMPGLQADARLNIAGKISHPKIRQHQKSDSFDGVTRLAEPGLQFEIRPTLTTEQLCHRISAEDCMLLARPCQILVTLPGHGHIPSTTYECF